MPDIEQLMHDNLSAVFNERDDAKCVELEDNLGPLQFETVGPARVLAGFGQLVLIPPAS